MRIKYVLKKFKTMKFKDFCNKAKEVGKKNNKNFVFVMFDMASCALKYGAGYNDYANFEFYRLNKDERKTYLTGRYINDIVNKYNKKEDLFYLDDRVEFNKKFKNYISRGFIDLRDVTFKEFKEFISDKDKIIAKSVSTINKSYDVIDLDKTKLKNEYNILKIYNGIMKDEKFLIEDNILQNKNLDFFNDRVVVRVNTFLDEKQEVHILNVVLKVNDIYTFLDEKGKIYVPFVSESGKIYSENSIIDFKLPFYEKLDSLVSEIALVVPSLRYVGWDFMVTEDGLVLIEGNTIPRLYQAGPSVSGIKTGDLEKYKKYMDI